MITTYVGIGSNIDRHTHVEAAIEELAQLGTDLKCSTIYESLPIGFDGHPFFNLVVEFRTALSLAELARQLRDIELRWGRSEQAQKNEDRTLDLDIVLYGDICSTQKPELPRSDIYRFPFVIQPLFELCPELILPGDGRSIRQIWLQSDQQHLITPVKTWFTITTAE
ncbi:2-amino-4-hydroxy-6-hydroxymethyldihydropteridine diphosphokinase [Vibrio palustris]|uniref:2-amino-4-hydroxy-6-hydroxymethyldihydropteridine diphosphokinase n=1 Tax=Vibrio palustris TaxID=1918946 RepID=A0A1R4B7V7_9VIBR|nr:2-amino-4-hydroxy-6-hydroxymethyldihydropteridine diphosphokinase [Vibrio palustris]SJL85005.1 2-amino-4-hydroxy-6-hydroxymethyldihydropteridinepyrophosphokinase [Vibrio palustris]